MTDFVARFKATGQAPTLTTIRVLGRSVAAPHYCAFIRLAKANPADTFHHALRHPYPATGAEIMAEYHRDLARRICARGGIDPDAGRVHPATWSKAATPRVVLEAHDLRTMNRHQRMRLAGRARD